MLVNCIKLEQLRYLFIDKKMKSTVPNQTAIE